MLLPGREETFLPFMEIRRTPLSPLVEPTISVTDADAAAATEALRAHSLRDRNVYLLSQRAFPSWVRAYQEHRASSIFRVADLDFAAQARAWGLARLPAMPELKGTVSVSAGSDAAEGGEQAVDPIDRTLGLGVDVDGIAFADRAKEKKRQAELAQLAATAPERVAARAEQAAKRRRNIQPWSDKGVREGDKAERREKKRKRTEARKEARLTEAEREDMRKLEEMVGELRRRNEEKRRKARQEIEARTREEAAESAAAEGEEFEGFSD
jgi:ATP-dependent RNA helicase DDX55/SPB4